MRWRLLPLLVVLVGVVWAFGLAGYLGIPLTIVTIAGLPVMLGIGIDYAIQMHARVEEEVIIDRAEHPIQETARNLGPALLVVTFDAIFAFAALHFAKVPMIRDFGLLLAVGIAAICLGSIILPLAILGIREFKSPTQGQGLPRGPARAPRRVARVASRPGRAVLFAVASVGIFVGGIAVEDKLTLQTDPMQWVNQDSRRRSRTSTRSRARCGSSASSACSSRQRRLHRRVRDRSSTTSPRTRWRSTPWTLPPASSIETAIGDISSTCPVRPTSRRRGVDIEATYDVAPTDIKASTVSDDDTAMNIIFRTGPGSLEARAPMVRGSATRPIRPRASARPRRGSRSSASGCSTTSKPTGSCSPTSRSCSCSCSSRSGCARSSARCCRWCRC